MELRQLIPQGLAEMRIGNMISTKPAVSRMPAVFTALDTGRICRSKAWVFADLCGDFTAEQVDVVCVRLLPPPA